MIFDIPINKDIRQTEIPFILGLTKRQVIIDSLGIGVGVIFGIIMFLAFEDPSIAGVCGVIFMSPFLFTAHTKGMRTKPEKILLFIFFNSFLAKKKREFIKKNAYNDITIVREFKKEAPQKVKYNDKKVKRLTTIKKKK